jgi:hypothetical protein
MDFLDSLWTFRTAYGLFGQLMDFSDGLWTFQTACGLFRRLADNLMAVRAWNKLRLHHIMYIDLINPSHLTCLHWLVCFIVKS